MTEDIPPTEIDKGPYNYYGGLWIKREGGKCFWDIENYQGREEMEWHEIPASLFDELLKFQNT